MTEPERPEPDAAPSGVQGRQPERPVRVRRAPRYRAFGLTGLLAGVVLALLLDVLAGDPVQQPQTSFGPGSALAYLLFGLGLLGLVLGLGLALVVERRR